MYCAHHPARFVIFALLALLSLFIILIFLIVPIVKTCNIAQTVSHNNHHSVKWFFLLSGHSSGVLSCLCNFLLLPNHWLCGFNLVSCPSGLSLNIMFNPFLVLFTAYDVCFLSFLCRKLLLASQAVQCQKGSNYFSLQATRAPIRKMMWLGGTLCCFAVFARRKWWKVHFPSIDHCHLCWLCCWARCLMLQIMDSMEASCVFHVTFGILNHLEPSQIWLVTVNNAGIVRLTG